MLNRVVLIGRLTRDPDMRYTPAGVAVTQFTLAVDRPFSGREGQEREADFIPIVTWRQLAETCANYLKKGRLTAVEGRIQVRHYDNNECTASTYLNESCCRPVGGSPEHRMTAETNRRGGSPATGGSRSSTEPPRRFFAANAAASRSTRL